LTSFNNEVRTGIMSADTGSVKSTTCALGLSPTPMDF
jgi:hypothetical protein